MTLLRGAGNAIAAGSAIAAGNADASLRVGDFYFYGRGGLARADAARAATFYQARGGG